MSTADNDEFYTSAQFQAFFKNAERSLVMKADAPTFTILAVSDTYLSLTHRRREELLGNGLFEVFPGSHDDLSEKNSVHSSFMRAINTKNTDKLPVFKYEIFVAETDSYITEYWTNDNEPLLDEDGNVAYLINTTTNITRRVLSEKALEESENRLQLVNNELIDTNSKLTNSNEELAATNEELLITNDELIATQQQLKSALAEIKVSNYRFRSMIQSSPVAMLITRGEDMIFEEINEAMLLMIGKDERVKGKKWFDAIPELIGQPVINELYYTYRTGETHKIAEASIMLDTNNQSHSGYYDITYTPLVEDGVITGVMQSVADVTSQVKARKELEQAELLLRAAIEAANFGVWHLHPPTSAVTASARAKELFGFGPEEEFNIETAMARITDEYRDYVSAAIENAIRFGKECDLTYSVHRFNDNKLRWLRVIGKMNTDETGAFSNFSGIAMDVTEQRADEQRKNDFISMVSHELKTPLTSMSGYMQILQSKAIKGGDSFSTNLLGKADNQMKKMNTMINGFLNVSRLESGKIYIDKQRFDLAVLMKEIEDETLAAIMSHQLLFAPVEPTPVVADRDKIGQVVANLISNAVKYSPAGSTIKVACVTINNLATVSVKMKGWVLPPAMPQNFLIVTTESKTKQQNLSLVLASACICVKKLLSATTERFPLKVIWAKVHLFTLRCLFLSNNRHGKIKNYLIKKASVFCRCF